jgi:hypothetical protein
VGIGVPGSSRADTTKTADRRSCTAGQEESKAAYCRKDGGRHVGIHMEQGLIETYL